MLCAGRSAAEEWKQAESAIAATGA